MKITIKEEAGEFCISIEPESKEDVVKLLRLTRRSVVEPPEIDFSDRDGSVEMCMRMVKNRRWDAHLIRGGRRIKR